VTLLSRIASLFLLLVLISIALVKPNSAWGQQTRASVIPEPMSVEAKSGELTVRSGMTIAVTGDFRQHDPAEARWIAGYLSGLLKRGAGLDIPVLSKNDRVASTLGITLVLLPGQSSALSAQGREGYDLDVSHEGIVIRARSTAGLFYGAVTLWQLLTQTADHRGSVMLAAVHIHDEPRFAWRGVMLDSARHFQSAQFVEQLIDWMALHKLNTLHWHLTDDQGWRIEIKKYPRLTQVGAWRVDAGHANQTDIDPATGKPRLYGGYYTQQQIRDIVAYARERNVTIVPEIEMPGHATAPIAAYPQYGSTASPPTAPASEYGILPNLYNVDDATFSFLEDVLTEVMALFPSEYIHVGGDEAIKDQWRSNPAIQAKMHELGITNEDALQSYFTQRIERFLNAHQRRLIGWDEILEGGIAPNATVMSWRGVNGGITAAKAGHDAVLSPTRPLYLNYRQSDLPDEPEGRVPLNTLKDVYTFEPVPADLTPEESAHIIGVQANLWTEYVRSDPQVEHMLFPRVAALAEVGWSPAQQRNWPDFLTRLVPQFSRYSALGIRPADSVFEVRVAKQFPGDDKVQVSLSNQAEFGEIRVTTDGSAVNTGSPVYTGPLRLPLPSVLHAGTFNDGVLATPEIDETLNQFTVRRRSSEELQLCTPDPAIQIEDDAPLGGKHAVFLVNYVNPCWIYKSADLDGIKELEVAVGQLPFNFAFANHAKPVPRKPSTPFGELEVFDTSCTGKPVVTVSLEPAIHNDAVTKLDAPFPAMTGSRDLCFTFTRPVLDPMWVIDWVQLVPQS
jgi:hexosaminidase